MQYILRMVHRVRHNRSVFAHDTDDVTGV